MTITELHVRLQQLYLERLQAQAVGLSGCRAYMADLEDEVAECRQALTLVTLTEIASVRGLVHGRHTG